MEGVTNASWSTKKVVCCWKWCGRHRCLNKEGGELRENGPPGRNSKDEVKEVAGEDRFLRRGLGFM